MAAVRTFSFSFQFVIANKPLELGIRNVLWRLALLHNKYFVYV